MKSGAESWAIIGRSSSGTLASVTSIGTASSLPIQQGDGQYARRCRDCIFVVVGCVDYHRLELEPSAMNAFPTVVYELGALRKKLPALAVPTIEKAITELMRLARENETLQSAVRRAEVGKANDIRDCAACRERFNRERALWHEERTP